MLESARAAHAAGLCVLPAIPVEKRPALTGWKAFQHTLPAQAQIETWFPDATGMCLVCGKVSGNLEMIDFDNKGELFPVWRERIQQDHLGLFERLIVEQTPSGGFHVAYRCERDIPGNQKLAVRHIQCDTLEVREINGKSYKPLKRGDRWEVRLVLIETRGEGGLFLCAPTPGYRLMQGEFSGLPILTQQERDVLIAAARSLDESAATGDAPSSTIASSDQNRPGDAFNASADIRPLLIQHGWMQIREGENEHWRRPGKDTGTSATLKDGVFYVFSTNAAPFDGDKGYSPFQVYALLEHNGDFSAAARKLREDGYGEDDFRDIDLSEFLSHLPDPPGTTEEAGSEARPLCELFETVTDLDPPIIHGLLREGETMNVIAAPKFGKSWLVMRLAISIASGLDWFGMQVEHGRVLHIDNELRIKTIVHRYRTVAEALNVPHHLFSRNLDVKSLRGQLKDLNQLGEFFKKLEPNRYKAVVIDAFYRTLPVGTDENDNGAIANLYNKLDWYASRLKCAFILIHHSSKGNQAFKSVTDVGAGAGAQSRAADTHLILRPHEQPNVAVVEAAVRSWPPREPMCIRWEFPLWQPAQECDPYQLHGKVTESSAPKQEWTVERFIAECVMPFGPCSQSDILAKAKQVGLSEWKARSMITKSTENKLIVKDRRGSHIEYAAVRPGIAEGKTQHVAARILHNNGMSASQLAEEYGVSRRYIFEVKNQLIQGGLGGELTGELAENEFTSNGEVSSPPPITQPH